MTLRLVALMSVVLLVSLAAFAFLGSHYQDQVMDELAQTVSVTGRETLRALDVGLEPRFEFRVGDDGDPGHGDPGTATASSDIELHASVMTFVGDGSPPGKGNVVVMREESGGRREDGVWVKREQVDRVLIDGPLAAVIAEDGCEACPAGIEESTMPPGAAGHRITRVIRLADVRAETDPSHGLILKIPTRTSEDDDAGTDTPTGTLTYSWETQTGTAAVPAGATPQASATGEASPVDGAGANAFHELRLPIPTAEYQSLFDQLRRGSLALFFGVLLVGTALSAGLATRFTRPIRRLDAGIRRLSAGDLDVVVDASGPQEVGRLGRAFNDMARSLRAARDRERGLVRREKLSALGRLAAGVAHDVRNPLHSIGLTLQNLQDACRPEDAGRASDFDRSVAVIREEIHRLDRLVTGFLQFAHSDERPREPVDLGSLLRETARLVEREAARRGVRVDVEAADDVPPVPAQAASVRSSVLNLVLNSFEALPDGGRVALRLKREGDEAILEVEDDGKGIPEADRERVFEFAYTTREGGHGLGLPMVHKVVVEDHGGRIALDSRPGEGTLIRMALPLEPAGEARPEAGS